MRTRLKRRIKLVFFKIKQLLGKDEKIFIIGRNKTGTTSIEKCLENLGYIIGDQNTAELFIDDYAEGNFENILKYCDSAEVFQDAPFSWPGTYKHVYEKYPEAKYILLERDTAEEWYQSVVRFHRKLINKGEPVTVQNLKDFTYRRKGFLWQAAQVVYGVKENNIYDKDLYLENYKTYNKEVSEFFTDKDNFLSIKLSDHNVDETLANFLNKKKSDVQIPHLNRSK